ncbi:MAG: HsdR family type I site-specific deoxyribonuclease [Phaeodactylibacter sp.]|uniref:type I restriction endonuclease subunit R n=1 Tax=Phaeodactylibacter sp. TaxID=1940289 RepID=UPI0032F01176
MIKAGRPERHTQNRVIQLFQQKLGYRYLGNWEKRDENSNTETELLQEWLRTKANGGAGYDEELIKRALYKLNKTVSNKSKKLYYINQEVYQMLRYGVTVQPEVGKNKETVWLIDWEQPENNDFAVAEEVSVKGTYKKRPDIVLYINGIALGVLELKRSTKGVEYGIRQNLDNQKHLFIGPFFNTMQLVLAGNDTQGLRYGTIETPEPYYLRWKEVHPERNPNDKYLLELTRPIREQADEESVLLDRHIVQLLNKQRFLEVIHDFVVFDSGVKKLCRPNQYFGVKAAQDFVKRREGGIIWHTQGSGKSLTMVWLTKWIRSFNPNARVLIITDRTELDEQIEKVFNGVDEQIYRTKSGEDLISTLNEKSPWLLCSLVHKFGRKEEVKEKDIDNYLQDLKNSLPSDFKAKGDVYVFVDECHRTQSGKLHTGMKTLLPDALFIGFTGTPLLKKDKQTSLEVFGKYIHTYKFDEAVEDGVVLDLHYEARDVEQDISSIESIDEWFDAQTRGLTDYAKAELKSRWGTIKKVFSAKSRLEKIVIDITKDMMKLDRLKNGRGNAMLVSDSVYNACRYYELFQNAGLRQCAIVTSYTPNHNTIKLEDAGMGENEELIKYRIYQRMVADYFGISESEAHKRVEEFELKVKKQFVNEPGQMKLLIVVDKLLTGFDAPPATFLYIDKSMKDHGLFQAICRVNRLDDDSKEYGYIIDYKDLFKSLEKSISDYTSEAFDAYEKEDVQGLLKDRLTAGKERLEDMLEAVKALCEPVEPPKGSLQYQRYFVGDPENPEDIKDTEERRHAFYKAVAKLVRAYANIADEMEVAGYHETTRIRIKSEVEHFQALKEEVMLAADEKIDLKQYEPGMRQLIDFYLDAKHARSISKLEDMTLVELLIQDGEEALDELPDNIKSNKEAMAETIENNLRKVIIEERPTNPAYYEKMSTLLDELIRARKEQTREYEELLKSYIALAPKIKRPESNVEDYPQAIDTRAKKALYDNLLQNESLSLALDEAVRYNRKDAWRDNKFKTRQVRFAICVFRSH